MFVTWLQNYLHVRLLYVLHIYLGVLFIYQIK